MYLLNILIPSLRDRKHLLDKMVTELHRQATECKAEKEVKITSLVDQGEITIGTKRNRMLEASQGKYSAFFDDDDPVPLTYLKDVLAVLRVFDDVDCVGVFEEVFFQDKFAGIGIHSTLCSTWTEVPGTYYRHIDQRNPVRTELARKVKYQNIRWSEDHHWSVAVASAGLFKSEVFLGHKPLYEYRCRVAKKPL